MGREGDRDEWATEMAKTTRGMVFWNSAEASATTTAACLKTLGGSTSRAMD